jgi:hypothetical protein
MAAARGGKGHRKAMTSKLGDHKLKGKVLSPPFMQLSNVVFSSWRDDRLPEMLWAVILTAALERGEYLDAFSQVAGRAQRIGWDRMKGVEHSNLAKLDSATFDHLMDPVLCSARTRDALAVLLLFDGLPDRAHWQRNLRGPRGDPDIALLAEAVGGCMDHQSDQSTDCRWLRIIISVVLERMVFNTGMEARVRQLFEYPKLDDKAQLGGFIRSGEMTEPPDADRTAWPRTFWAECWRETDCIGARRRAPEFVATEKLSKSISDLYGEVAGRFFEVQTHTDLDARADAIFGLTLYSLYLGSTVLHQGAETRVEGRWGIRTLTECFITLVYLMRRDDPGLWRAYREYGSGQAKLAFLKLYELDDADLPSHVSQDELERLANEDIWQEYTNVDLGQWAGTDLRRMSTDAGVKDIYDKYYGWPSGFVHGHWGAVRDTVFDLCLNPLHRFHRIPAPPRLSMGSVAPDAVKLLNLVLDRFAEAYPPFRGRLRTEAKAPRRKPKSKV